MSKILKRIQKFITEPRTVTLIESNDDIYYYIQEYAGTGGFWLSKRFNTVDEAEKHIIKNWVNEIIIIAEDTKPYYRVVKPFAMWKIHSKKDEYHNTIETKISAKDERALDYRSWAIQEGCYKI